MNNFFIFTKIKNLLKIIHNFFKINPHRHWISFLYFFFILFSFLILLSIYFLYQINNGNLFKVKVKEQNTPVLLNEKILKNIINLQDKRDKKVLEIKNNPSLYSE